ncbi:hypothetical protein [Adhaeribacter terreus]|uniref:Uncharacterized protein n=1 Tax=Adhaeribacter terreus TaxID=529703 RepID=A0ABW0EDP0_9BACT
MKTSQISFLSWLIFLNLLFGSCQSSKPPLFVSGNTVPLTSQPAHLPSENELYAAATIQIPEPKTVAIPAEKVLPASRISQPKPIFALVQPDQPTNFPGQKLLPEKPDKALTVKTQDEPEKVRGRTLSGIFLAAGTILLLIALGLVIAGTSGAGVVAWIGGGLFLTGFIFSMVALLGR